MNEINLKALDDNLSKVIDFVSEEMEKEDFSIKQIMQTSLAIEEIFVNICRYAYNPETGNCTIRVYSETDNVTIEIIDYGKPYDPLAKEDADITLSAEERDVGGLGILMTKKLMDDVKYQFVDGKNILKLYKKK